MSTGEIAIMIVVLCLAPLFPAICCLLCLFLPEQRPVATSDENVCKEGRTASSGCYYCGGSGYYKAYSSLSGEGGRWEERCPFCNEKKTVGC